MPRADATLTTDLPAYRTLQLSLLRRRMDAVVFLRVPVEVDDALDALDTLRETGGPRVSLFQVVLGGVVETLHERPHMNRFVKGGRLWQRDHVALTFAVKRTFTDEARIVSTKVRFAPGDGLPAVVAATADAIHTSRTADRPPSERRSRGLAGQPRAVRALALRLVDRADELGWLSRRFLDDSPLHTSAMVSNLGSLGLDGALHHLYEPGTCSINLTVGKVRRVPVADDDGAVRAPRVLELAFAYDERICDGFYAAETIRRLVARVSAPDLSALRP